MTGRWNAASICLFIACIIAMGSCCGGRARVKGLTQPALPRESNLLLSQQLWGGEGSPLGQSSGWKMNAQPLGVKVKQGLIVKHKS